MAPLLHKLIYITLCGTIILLDPVTSNETKRKCGVISPDATTGEKAHSIGNLNTFPWTVIIADDTKELCLGSLIHPKVVLTVAHCLRNPIITAQNLIIFGGERRQERTANNTIIHTKNKHFNYDFGLVILDEAITLDEHVNTICLPPQDHNTAIGTKCLVSSWSYSDKEEEKHNRKLHLLNFTTIGRPECEEKLLNSFRRGKLDESVFCATENDPTDSDNRDSGAPLICSTGSSTADQYHQIGISSFGVLVHSPFPTGFANVASARSWIDEVMKENELDTSSYTT